MRIDAAFPSKYLKAADLQDRAVTVSMSHVAVEEIKSMRGMDTKPVLYFQGKEKGLVLNKTNSNAIAKLYGEETDDWVGQPIEIFPTTVDFQGDMVEAIRVRAPRKKNGAATTTAAPAPPPAPTAHDLDDEIPF